MKMTPIVVEPIDFVCYAPDRGKWKVVHHFLAAFSADHCRYKGFAAVYVGLDFGMHQLPAITGAH
jgi:hypothetical protein